MNRKTQFESVESFHKQTSILNLAMVAGVTMFAGITWVLAPRHIYTVDVKDIFTILSIMMVVTLAPSGYFIYQRRIAEARAASDLQDKLNLHRQGFIMYCASLEAPIMFALISAFLTNVVAFYAFALVPYVLLIAVRPGSLAALKQQLDITD